MPVTTIQEFASKTLRRINELDPLAKTTLAIAHRSTIYELALGKNVDNLNKRLTVLKSFHLPARRRSKYEYDYDHVVKALIISCYKKALDLPTCPKEDKMFLECMVDKNTIRPAHTRAAPKNVIQFTAPAKNKASAIINDFEHELLICK